MLPHIDAIAPRRDAVLFLPRLREIIHQVFAEDGWLLRDPGSLRYQTTLGDGGTPNEITVTIAEPVRATITGQWRDPHSAMMRFHMPSLECGMVQGRMPIFPTEPPSQTHTQSPFPVDEIPIPPPAPEASTTTRERELRSIEL